MKYNAKLYNRGTHDPNAVNKCVHVALGVRRKRTRKYMSNSRHLPIRLERGGFLGRVGLRFAAMEGRFGEDLS